VRAVAVAADQVIAPPSAVGGHIGSDNHYHGPTARFSSKPLLL
jgi:hypothetical protein